MTFGVKQLLMTNPHTSGAELALGKWQKGLSFFLAAALGPRGPPSASYAHSSASQPLCGGGGLGPVLAAEVAVEGS